MNTYLNTSSIEKGSITKDMLEDDVVSSLEILESNASSTKAGLMSAEDKTKLDGFGSANDYATKDYVNEQIGNINTILEEIINM